MSNIIEDHYSIGRGDPADRLPESRRPKLLALGQARDDARATVHPLIDQLQEMRLERNEIQARLKRLRNPAAYGGFSLGDDALQVQHEEKKLEKLNAKIARLVELEQERSARANAIGQLYQSCAFWILEGIPGGTTVAPFESEPITPKKGEGFADAVETRRRRLRENGADRRRFESAPIPSAILKCRAVEQVQRLAEGGAPDLSQALHHGGDIEFPMLRVQSSVLLEKDYALAFAQVPDTLGLFAWVFRKQLLDALFAEIDSEADDANALDDNARAKALATIASDTLAIEREEESLIEQAEAQGISIQRRVDANPLAVLGLALVTAPARPETSLMSSIIATVIR